MPKASVAETAPMELRHVDKRVWRACAGSSVQIPIVNSTVYYFPQGHLEHSDCGLTPSGPVNPAVLCRVSAVHHLADPVSDEVFARFLLEPIPVAHSSFVSLLGGSLNGDGADDGRVVVDDDDGEESRVTAYAKVLTPSDANNGGGFSVPRFCAESIFPGLDYKADPPVQTLSVTDVHGRSWEFRHIYRGTPRRHLLTTGWSKFVNSKKLIAGDSVVFMRDERWKLFIGVRRAAPSGDGGDYARWSGKIGSGDGGGGSGKVKELGGVFPKGGRMMSCESVMRAVEMASMGMAFEVVYYPRAWWSCDFIVRAGLVERAMNLRLCVGMRVKMGVETEDSLRTTWFLGSVTAAAVPENGPWRGSPWRMLKIAWDDSEVLQNADRVNPWQVDLAPSGSPFIPAVQTAKKLKSSENSGFLTSGSAELSFPTSDITNSPVEHQKLSLWNSNFFPAGMQGARQNPFSLFGITNLSSENAPNMHLDLNFDTPDSVFPQANSLSTELNIDSMQSDILSPETQCSVHPFSTELNANQPCNSEKDVLLSVKLFGTIICQKPFVVGGGNAVDDMGDNGLKGSNENEAANDPKDDDRGMPFIDFLGRSDQR